MSAKIFIKLIKRTTCRGLFSLVILLPASNVMSESISYDYAQADYISDTVDLAGSIADVEGNGIGFSISLSFAPAFAVKLAVASTTFRAFQGVQVDTAKVTVLGVTGHTSVAKNFDVFVNVAAIKAEITANKGANSTSENDYSAIIDVGSRYRLTDNIELEALVSHVRIFGYTLNSTAVGGRYYFRTRLSAGVTYVANDIHDSLLITARMGI